MLALPSQSCLGLSISFIYILCSWCFLLVQGFPVFLLAAAVPFWCGLGLQQLSCAQ